MKGRTSLKFNKLKTSIMKILILIATLAFSLNVSAQKTVEHYPNGTIHKKGMMKKNKKHGRWLEYSKEANVISVMVYKKGTRNGIYQIYNEAGELKVAGTHRNGVMHGVNLTYYKNGTVKMNMTYKKGEIHGDFHLSYGSAHIQLRGKFRNGKRVGKWKWYSKEGKLIKIVEYKNGKEQ